MTVRVAPNRQQPPARNVSSRGLTAPVIAGVGLCFLAVGACGDGGDGGPGPEPRRQARVTAPSLTTAPGQVQSVELRLGTNETAAALQLDVVTSPEVISSVTGASTTARGSSLDAFFQNISAGRARIVLFDPEGNGTIAAGEGPVVLLSFRASATATPGVSPLGLENAVVIGPDEEPFEVILEPGQITVTP